LLAGECIIEEKMDGANTGIVRHKKGFHLQKKGSLVGASEHAQFQYFHHWANQLNYDKIMSLPVNYWIYGELLFAVHHIYYDSLPDYFLIFDVWDGRKYLDYSDRAEFCEKHGFHMVPFIDADVYDIRELVKYIPERSAYGEIAEGIVVKRYRRGTYLRGKIVKPGFMKELEESEHWSKYDIKRNKLA